MGLPPVRELYKTLNSEHADGALLVTSGSFTLDAESFARDKPIGLIDGPALLELVATVKRDAPGDASNADAPCCPVCERPMKQKKASSTSTIGHVYWGCSAYPRCLGTRPVQLAGLGLPRYRIESPLPRCHWQFVTCRASDSELGCSAYNPRRVAGSRSVAAVFQGSSA